MRKFATLAVAVFAMSCIAIANVSPTHATAKKTDESSTKNVDKKSTKKKKTVRKYTVKAGDTLDAIAKKFHTNYPRLYSANKSIINPDVIDIGDVIHIPGKKEKVKKRALPTPVSAAVAVSQPVATTTTQSYTTAPVNSSSYYVGNGMWCTDYVHSKRPDVAIYGNAGYNWIDSAKSEGKSTGSAPKKGAVAVTNGHVAYVESVNSDGSYTVSEMGWNYQAGNYNKRTVQPGEFGAFIY